MESIRSREGGPGVLLARAAVEPASTSGHAEAPAGALRARPAPAVRRVASRRRRIAIAIAASVAAAAVVGASSAVDGSITPADVDAILALEVETECTSPAGTAAQVACVRAVQAALDRMVPSRECAAVEAGHEPADVLARGSGCCFDRSRFIEKALRHYGLRTRHVALYETDSRGPMALVTSVNSHAISEVATDAGWMVVDANDAFLGLTADGDPLDAVELRAGLRDGSRSFDAETGRAYFHGRYVAAYGLHSRHGAFFAPRLPVPDVAWGDVGYNLGF